MTPSIALAPRSAFSGLRLEHDGILVVERDGVGLATVQARKGRIADLRASVAESFGIELPTGAARASAGGVAFAGTAPGTWIASQDDGGNTFAASLSKALGDRASVVDQSDAFGLLQLSGLRARDLLMRLVPVDIHPRVFGVGRVASTVSGLVGVTLWRLDDRAGGVPAFEIAIYRSLAATFMRALGEIAPGLAVDCS